MSDLRGARVFYVSHLKYRFSATWHTHSRRKLLAVLRELKGKMNADKFSMRPAALCRWGTIPIGNSGVARWLLERNAWELVTVMVKERRTWGVWRKLDVILQFRKVWPEGKAILEEA